MASIAGTGISVSLRPPCYKQGQVIVKMSGLKLASFSRRRKNFPAVRLKQTLQFSVSCAAKPETLEKVCAIVKKQLALPQGTSVTGASTFIGLGADSLDTVEIVMDLEEAFGISVEEDNAQSITTVQDAADLIENLVEAKSS